MRPRKSKFHTQLQRVRWAFACAALVLSLTRAADAEQVVVPIDLQAELLAKVAGYDKNLAQRAGDQLRVLVLTKKGNADSIRIASQLERSLKGVGSIGGLPHEVQVAPLSTPAALAS